MRKSRFKFLLLEKGKRGLSSEERAELDQYLAKHPEAKTEYDEETQLDEVMDAIPEVSVSEGFTDSVLDRVRGMEQDSAETEIVHVGWFRKHRIQLTGLAACCVLIASFAFRPPATNEYGEIAESLSLMAGTEELEIIADFEAIHALGGMPDNVDE